MSRAGIIIAAAVGGAIYATPVASQSSQQPSSQKPASSSSAWTTPDPFAGQNLESYKTPLKTPTAPNARLDGAFDSAVKSFRESPIRPSYNPTYRAPMLEFRQKF